MYGVLLSLRHCPLCAQEAWSAADLIEKKLWAAGTLSIHAVSCPDTKNLPEPARHAKKYTKKVSWLCGCRSTLAFECFLDLRL